MRQKNIVSLSFNWTLINKQDCLQISILKIVTYNRSIHKYCNITYSYKDYLTWLLTVIWYNMRSGSEICFGCGKEVLHAQAGSLGKKKALKGQ